MFLDGKVLQHTHDEGDQMEPVLGYKCMS